MSTKNSAYQELHQLSKHLHLLQGISQLLDWDQQTYMPPSANDIRSEQLEALAGMHHRGLTGAAFTTALSQLIDLESGQILASDLSAPQEAALKYWRRDYHLATALPTQFVEEFTRLTSQAQSVWKEAKESNAFHCFAPFLDKIVMMNRKKADLLGYDTHPYDALIDLYEPEMTHRAILELFSELKSELTPLLKEIKNAPEIDERPLHGDFPTDQQIEFSHLLLDMLGYTKEHGRLDLAAHPFSTSPHPTDSRITTRVDPHHLHECISAVLHEAGHAFYSMGLPVEHYGSPLGDAISYGIHESQSRWWETRIGASKPFWQHLLPLLKKYFPNLRELSLEAFYAAINRVKPSLIRVGADEVTYPLHIILRTELEANLIEGSLSVRDLPEAWKSGMQTLLGIAPATDQEGCLQDIHWSGGSFGYFPSYTIGNIYTAQLFESFEKEHSNWATRVGAGDFIFIKKWLNKTVHRYGRQYSSQEILKMATGRGVDVKPYINYLKLKYGKLYGLKTCPSPLERAVKN